MTMTDEEAGPLVAVMVAVPTFNGVTTPALTLATAELLEVQLTTAAVTVWPSAARTVAVSVATEPEARASAPGADSVTLAGVSSGVTVIWTVELTPLADAVIVAVPGATPETTPACDTAAILVAELVQAICAPLTVAPPASRAVAASDTVEPTVTVLALAEICSAEIAPWPGGPDGPSPPQATRIIAATPHATARRIIEGGSTVPGQKFGRHAKRAVTRLAMARRGSKTIFRKLTQYGDAVEDSHFRDQSRNDHR
ncbi:MAG: hypothetical protein ABI625_21010, partial [bacterium]